MVCELDGDPKFLTSRFTLPAITVRGRRGVAAGGGGGGGELDAWNVGWP